MSGTVPVWRSCWRPVVLPRVGVAHLLSLHLSVCVAPKARFRGYIIQIHPLTFISGLPWPAGDPPKGVSRALAEGTVIHPSYHSHGVQPFRCVWCMFIHIRTLQFDLCSPLNDNIPGHLYTSLRGSVSRLSFLSLHIIAWQRKPPLLLRVLPISRTAWPALPPR